MNKSPLRIGLSVSSDGTKVEGIFVIPRGRDIAGSIVKYKEIKDYQKRSIYIQKETSFKQKYVVL